MKGGTKKEGERRGDACKEGMKRDQVRRDVIISHMYVQYLIFQVHVCMSSKQLLDNSGMTMFSSKVEGSLAIL